LIASCGILVSHKYYISAFLLVFFTQGAHVLTDFIKNIICRQRPCGDSYPGYSFPSGHSLTAMCFFGILIYLVHRHISGFWKYFFITIFGMLIILNGLSRLWLGVHFPTDVLEGMFLGFILVNLYIILDKFFSR
jgi:undecaprenyl-diphosphatase